MSYRNNHICPFVYHKNLPQGTVDFQPIGECGRRFAPSSFNDKIERMCYD